MEPGAALLVCGDGPGLLPEVARAEAAKPAAAIPPAAVAALITVPNAK